MDPGPAKALLRRKPLDFCERVEDLYEVVMRQSNRPYWGIAYSFSARLEKRVVRGSVFLLESMEQASPPFPSQSLQSRILCAEYACGIIFPNPGMDQPLSLRDEVTSLFAALAFAQSVRVFQMRQYANIFMAMPNRQ
jgi:hypothetical protein